MFVIRTLAGAPPLSRVRAPVRSSLAMIFLNAFLIALREIRRNLMRAFLTVLGVIIGVAAVIAMIVFMSAPQQSVSPTMADAPALSAADRAFVTRSLQRHEAYAGQPFNGALSIPVTPGNARSDEGGDYESDEYIP